MKYDDLYDSIGEFGLFQVIMFLLVSFTNVIDDTTAYNYITYRVDYWCDIPGLDRFNLTQEQRFNLSAPLLSNGEHDHCNVYDVDYENLTESHIENWNWDAVSSTRKCERWLYDTSEYTLTTVSEYDLVCGRANLVPLPQSIYFAGAGIGTFGAGLLSDRFGRKRTMLYCMVIEVVGGTLAAFVPYYSVFCIGRFLMGLAGNAMFVSGFIVVMEVTGQKYRPILGYAFPVANALTDMFTPLVGYYVRNFRYMQFLVVVNYSYHFFLVLFFMPEPPRWLIQQNRLKEAADAVRRIARINKKDQVPDDLETKFAQMRVEELKLRAEEKSKRKNITHLYSSKVMRIRTIAIDFHWFVDSLMYYALATNASSLSGNVYINTLLLIMVELPAVLLGGFLAGWKFTGRRYTVSFSLVIAGIAALILSLLLGVGASGGALNAMSLTGKSFVTMAFYGIYIYSAETFPTEVRHVGMGFASLCARVAGIIAPYMGPPLEVYWLPLPSVIFGSLAFLGGLFLLILPETLGLPMCQTIEESEQRTIKGYKGLRKELQEKEVIKMEISSVDPPTSHPPPFESKESNYTDITKF